MPCENRTSLGPLVGTQIEINYLDKVSSLRFASLFSQNLKHMTSGTRNSLKNAVNRNLLRRLIRLHFDPKVLDTKNDKHTL